MNILRATAANAVDEIGKMIARRFARRSRFHILAKPGLVSVVAIDGEKAVGPVEEVADGVGLGVFRTKGLRRLLAARCLLAAIARQPCRRDSARAIASCANLRPMIGDPVAHFELHHLALAARRVKVVSRVQDVRRLLVIVKHEVPAHRRDHHREAHTEAPARDVNFMDRLIAALTVARVPDPVPVVVETIFGEWLQRRRTGPQIVVHARGHGLWRRVTDGLPPLVAKRARQIDVAERSTLHLLNGLNHAGIRARLAAVLADAVVLLHRAHQLTPFKPVVRAGFFDIDIFASLACPYAHERMPVVGRGDRDRVNIFVLEQLADVGVALRLGLAKLLHVAQAVGQDALVYIT